MKQLIQNLKRISKLDLWKNLSAVVIALVSFQISATSSFHKSVDQKLFHPLVFWAKSKIKEPFLDPRIKIFSFDDRTAAGLNSLDIPLPLWASVLQNLSQKKDVKIFIDKLFDVPYSEEDIKKFQATMAASTTDVSVISWAHPEKIMYRSAVPDDLIEKNSASLMDTPSHDAMARFAESTATIYAAPPAVLKSFAHFGLANYEGDNLVRPVLRLASERLMVHAAFVMARKLEINQKGLFVNDHRVPLDKNGEVLINFAPKSLYLKNALSFLPVVNRTKAGKDLANVIQPGDYVVLLPAMFTGNTDFRETPFGPMAGGYHIVALLQSVLSGEWLSQWHDPGVFVLLFGVLGYILAFFLRPRHALALMPVIALSLVGVSLWLFISFGIAWSFVMPLLGFVSASVAGMSLRNHVVQIEELRIQRELEVATLVQKTFFPDETKPIEERAASRLKIQGEFEPASECGGDWWGSFHSNGYTYVMLGDAVGHGVPAALVTAVAFSVVKTIEIEMGSGLSSVFSPSHLMKDISRVLLAMNSQLACMTFLAFRIHDETGECVFANAGNQQPFLIPKDPGDARLPKGQRCKVLAARGNVLGVDPDANSEDHTITLVAGDKIAMFTDGIIENSAQSNGKQLGRPWLKNLLQKHADLESSVLCQEVWSGYKYAIGNIPPNDDTTLVVIQF